MVKIVDLKDQSKREMVTNAKFTAIVFFVIAMVVGFISIQPAVAATTPTALPSGITSGSLANITNITESDSFGTSVFVDLRINSGIQVKGSLHVNIASGAVNGTVCSTGTDCYSNNCYVDADGDRYAPTSGTKTCKDDAQLGTDCNDANASIYEGTSGGSTCSICNADGSISVQTSAQDLFSECTASTCSATGNCSGSGYTCNAAVPVDSDPNNVCSALTCTNYVSGWSGNSCVLYSGSSSHNGMCTGGGACFTTADYSCTGTGSQSGTAACGSAGCDASCPAGGTATSYNTVAEVCYTDSAQHSCSAGSVCDGTGTCKVSNGQTCTTGTDCLSGICYVDADGDRYAPTSGTKTCRASSSLGTDCNDASASIYPGTSGGSTCSYCNSDGSITAQTSAQDLFSECTGSACTATGSCSGSGYSCGSTVVADADPNGACSATTCTNYIYGWSGNSCRLYSGSSSHNGMCNGSGACYTTVADSCSGTGSQSGTAACGSAGCLNSCVANAAATSYDTVAEVCYTGGQACTGGTCDATGTCKLSNGQTCTTGTDCLSGSCYVDADGDRYAPTSGTKTCKASSSLGTDCNDANAAIYPGTSGGSTCSYCNASGTITAQTSIQDVFSECAGSACTATGYCSGSGYSCNAAVPADSDPNGACSATTCTDYISGWSGNSCRLYAGSSGHNGMCNGSGACYTTVTDSCTGTGSQSGTAACDSAGCLKSCPAGGTATSYDISLEVCYADGAQHSCSAGYRCTDSGLCTTSLAVCPSWDDTYGCTGSVVHEELYSHTVQGCLDMCNAWGGTCCQMNRGGYDYCYARLGNSAPWGAGIQACMR